MCESFTIGRRGFLLGLAALGAPRLAFAADGQKNKVLVFLFLRGGIDGLSVIVPHAEPAYYAARPSLAVARRQVIDLDGRFGLHPKLAPLERLWKQRQFAAVHAVGSPHPTRSHFDAQDYLETGTPGQSRTADGWLGRALAERSTPSPLRVVAFSERLPRSLAGRVPALATRSLQAVELRGPGRARDRMERAFSDLYAGGDDVVRRGGREALSAVRRVREVRRQSAARGAPSYPPPARALADVAALIHADVGLEVAFVDVGGWDTHAGQGAENGGLARRLDLLARGLDAFAKDLGDKLEHVVVLAASEFGRTVAQNGSGGTDHGHGSVMLLLGGGVGGGKVYGRFPGLEREQRYEGRDLAVTTDFRDVFAEVIVKQLGVTRTAQLFPGYSVDPGRFLGVLG